MAWSDGLRDVTVARRASLLWWRKVTLAVREGPLLLEVLLFLVVYATAVRWMPFERLARPLGTVRAMDGSRPTVDPTPHQADVARRVGWAVGAIERRAHGAFVCLPRALAAARVLRTRRVPYTLVLGTRFDAHETALTAHAWLTVGRRLVTGGRTVARYRPVAAFDHRPRT